MLENKVQASCEQGTHAKTRGFVLWECGVKTGKITKPLGFMVCSQEGTKFIVICITSYTSTKTQNLDSSVLFVAFRFKILQETSHLKACHMPIDGVSVSLSLSHEAVPWHRVPQPQSQSESSPFFGRLASAWWSSFALHWKGPALPKKSRRSWPGAGAPRRREEQSPAPPHVSGPGPLRRAPHSPSQPSRPHSLLGAWPGGPPRRSPLGATSRRPPGSRGPVSTTLRHAATAAMLSKRQADKRLNMRVISVASASASQTRTPSSGSSRNFEQV